MKKANLIVKLRRSLPQAPRNVLAALERTAPRLGVTLYLVGGPVRDLLLGRATLDLDLTVEGDAPTLARQAAAALGARCLVHPAFLTATIKGQGFALDLATARAESYQRPGALPTVRPATIREDLLRRDFTINAMALALSGPRKGELLDPCGGQSDLEAGLIRALHQQSFQDDATRILRAARYEARFRFRLEERTLAWIRRDVGFLDTISGPRIRQELARILQEEEPERALRRLEDLGALRAIHPALSFPPERAEAFARLRQLLPSALPTAYWPLLAWPLPEGEAASLAARLALPRAQAQALAALPRLQQAARDMARPDLRPSQAVEALAPYPPAAIAALAAASKDEIVRDRCLAYLRRWRYVKPALDGHALLAMGLPPGPRVGEVLRRLRTAKLDGEVKSKRQEERLVRELLSHPEVRPR